ncbi:MAG: low molecular weight protein-tyrosine phosphatase [Solirubrobacteraceae bacterium]|nr:low molecular weight protein-tyrosine phosphatase [Solirubrobacteraceae bacterium]MEA2138340.1 low molecular weight protein-tyrosine phosphatase [Solirubrobacteraceae bacterium]
MAEPAVRLLFVCMGNICRSPTAEGVMAHLLEREGLTDAVAIDSAGTGGWHVGSPPDERSTSAAATRGIALRGAARQVRRSDFERFDLLLCADADNLRDVRALAPDGDARAKVRRLREFDPLARASGDLDIPDPYFGGARGFEDVLDLVERACQGLLEDLRERGLV